LYDGAYIISDGATIESLGLSEKPDKNNQRGALILYRVSDYLAPKDTTEVVPWLNADMPPLGFEQPLKNEYSLGKNVKLQKTASSLIESYQIPDPFDPHPKNCRQIYNRLGRLIRIEVRRSDDETNIYEYSNFKKLNSGSYIPQKIVCQHIATIYAGKKEFRLPMDRQILIATEISDTPLSPNVFTASHLPARVAVWDRRYHTSRHPQEITYFTDGKTEIDDATKNAMREDDALTK
jgi:hypothetical protein